MTSREHGFSLMEVCVASALIGPLMIAMMSASGAVGGALEENERSADVTTQTRSVTDRMQKILMSATPDTLAALPTPIVRVLQTDVIIAPRTAEFYTSPSTTTTTTTEQTATTEKAGTTETTATTEKSATTEPSSTQTTTKTATEEQSTATAEGTYVTEEERKAAELEAEKKKLEAVRQTGEAITDTTSLLDMGDHSHYVTSYDNYTDYRDQYIKQLNGELEWESMEEFRPTETLRFQAAVGTLSMNAESQTEVRSLEFIRDRNESLNARDDDGDGMIDEGKLVFTRGNIKTILIDNVEVCTFTLEGKVIRFAIRCCRRDHRGRVHRTTLQKRILIRNKN